MLTISSRMEGTDSFKADSSLQIVLHIFGKH